MDRGGSRGGAHPREIAAWDGVYAKESRAAALYESWRGASDLGGAGAQAGRRPTAHDAEKRIHHMLKVNQDLDRRWGQQHTRAFRHPLLRAFDLPTVERSGGPARWRPTARATARSSTSPTGTDRR